jgi:hypothetical protein
MSDVLRPGRYSDEVVWKVARLLAVDLQWQEYEDSEEKGYDGSELQALVDTLRDESDWDGYCLAKHLDEDFNIPVTADTVNTLDVAHMYQVKAHTELVLKWVLATEGVPLYSKDATVRVKSFKHGVEYYTGVIREVRAPMLTYTIFIQEHADESRTGTYIGTIYNQEDILGLGQ